MKKSITLIFSTLFSFNILLGQTTPCLPVQGGEPAGNEAPGCMLCSPIYNGSTAGYSASAPGSAGFPCGTIENNQFMSVLVDNTGYLAANILSSNCQNGQGVEIMIYDEMFYPVSNCFSSSGTSLPGNVQATGLTPGQIYWIMVDGFAGDICDISVTIFGGANFTPPASVGNITAVPDTTLCPGATACYSISTTQNDINFDWDVPGNAKVISGGGIKDKEICLEFLSPGGGVVRVTPTTICHTGVPSIFPISVIPQLPEIRPVQNFCQSDFPVVLDGNIFETPGSYTVNHKNSLNCDSAIVYTILAFPHIPNIVDTVICQGEQIIFDGQVYSAPGGYEIVLENATKHGCDSLIKLQIIVPNNQTEIIKPDTLDCLPGSLVQLTSINYPTTGFFRWSSGSLGNYITGATASAITVGSEGIYYLETEASEGGKTCFAVDTVRVQKKPAPAVPLLDTIENYSCRQDSVVFLFDSQYSADSLLWTFVGLDTFKTAWNDTVKYSASGYFDTLKIQGENYCGLGNSFDTVLNIRPVSPPGLDFFATEVCVNDTVFVTVPTLDTNVNFQWQLNGGNLFFSGQPDTFGIIWNSPGTKTVRINTVQDTCYSAAVSEEIDVLPPLDLNIRCRPELDRILFSWNKIHGVDTYSGSVVTGQNFTQTDTTLSVIGLIPDEEVTIELEINGSHPCGVSVISKTCKAENCPGYALTIDPVNKICLDGTNPSIQLTSKISSGAAGGVYEWTGVGLSPGGIFSPTVAGVGNHRINLKYFEGNCAYLADATILIDSKPVVGFDYDSPICLLENGLINYSGNAGGSADYNWNFSAGTIANRISSTTYEVNYLRTGTYDFTLQVEENGCQSNLKTGIIEVEKPLDSIINNCTFTVSGVVFDWLDIPDVSGYSINSISGHTGVLNGSSYTVSGLLPGEEVSIEVIAGSQNTCPDVPAVLTCKAADCPPVNLSIDSPGDICLGGGIANTIQLRARRNGIYRPGNYVWSGSNVTSGGVFNPNAAGTGIHPVTVVMDEGVCSYSATFDVIVFEKPTADFTIPFVICEKENATVLYSGNATSDGNFYWDFGGATIINNSGAMNYELNFPSSGDFSISLSVEENGCISDTVLQNIQVDEELEKPNISCTTSTSEINFEWNAVPNALTFDVISISGHSPNFTTPLSANFSGLSPNDEVEILVRATGTSVCGPSDSTLACIAKICPPVDLNIESIPQPICTGDSTNISLSANPFGGVGGGIFEWSGTNVTSDGFIEIAALSAGQYSVILNYEENNCRYTDSVFFEIDSNPELTARIVSPIWFPGTSGDINLDVHNGRPPYSYLWDNAKTVQNLTDIATGEHCVTVTDSNGCENRECFRIGTGNFRITPIHLMCQGDSKAISVRPSRGATFHWFPNDGLSCDNCPNPIVRPSKSTTYQVTATTSTGRVGKKKVSVIVLPRPFCPFLKPNGSINEGKLIIQLTEGVDVNNFSKSDLKKIESKAKKLLSNSDVRLFPNPTSGKTTILTESEFEKLEVYDFSGRKILEEFSGDINLSGYPQGVYFVKITTSHEEFVKRLIVIPEK